MRAGALQDREALGRRLDRDGVPAGKGEDVAVAAGPAREASSRSPASREWRETSTRGIPTPSSRAVSESIPCAAPRAFIPTAGRQQATVGEATATPSAGCSTTSATFCASPASHCSLCASSVVPGATAVNVEQRSAGTGSASSSSEALTAKSSWTGTPAAAAIAAIVAVRSGSARSAACQ
jgi:hypothetical protein